ncbi:bifunctional [glutamine synthetase] adenylyltransferase/[glutamine synthetase]-adenylyl-L-tyrosine phosphorylase [Georgenia sp. MJ170]|uniref:bifunctional [glutamine synthetase] adenylyltransferase/[glutamine synthetase]-adenylyl-L-tyrosine phosphorylase n=1 Tax=Georgenia sunbinii TaxID=3117728 RepID=UPI002F260265
MRAPTSSQELLRHGFSDVRRSAQLLGDATLAAVLGRAEDAGAPLTPAIGATADPDLALLALLRLVEAWQQAPDDVDLPAVLATAGGHRRRLLAVLGASRALGDRLVAHPGEVELLSDVLAAGVLSATPADERATALRAVGADPAAITPAAAVTGVAGSDALRRWYRRRLLQVTAIDLTSDDALDAFPPVAAALSDLAGAAIDAALAVARAELPDHGAGVRLAVVGMGKTGGRELNYVSDVDVIYVADGANGLPEESVTDAATRLATAAARLIDAPQGEELPLWPIDANLRPEGKDGPLVRTVASHRAYYERWAATWEFQALLKARPIAGDVALGQEYVEVVEPFVWRAVERANFVEDSQAMRRRVEANIPPAEADRQLKLGRGGLRDVEFTVQLLQLVHGRTEDAIKAPGTLDALEALADSGYIGRDPAGQLDHCYRLLRVLEHRMQLFRLRRTHVIPAGESDLRRLGRSLGVDGVRGAQTLEKRLREVRRDVRRLHEEIFYRPLLPLLASLGPADATLSPEAVRARLAAIGYVDPAGAVRHLESLTAGVSRTAAIQRQLLPAMLGLFAEGADPDAGLLAFRKLSESLGSTPWYLTMLRDSGAAAPRLTYLLATSRYVAEGLEMLPEAARWLGDDDHLRARTPEQLDREARSLVQRRPEPHAAAQAMRYLRRRELVRSAVGDVLDGVTSRRDRTMISAVADQALRVGLDIAIGAAGAELGLDTAPSRFLVVAMGRLGGSELTYGSDADVLFVHDPLPGLSEEVAQQFAVAVAGKLRALLGESSSEPPLLVDAALRPEGRNGPLVRSLASYAQYYERWAEPWEYQALLRARPVAGDDGLAERFVALIDPLRYPSAGIDERAVREIRRIKARMEAERLPRGVPANRHLKLGRGGLTDVEWTVQLLQLCHAGELPELRTTETLGALAAAEHAGLLTAEDTELLADAWRLASRLRAAITLSTGRTTGGRLDVLPSAARDLAGISRLLGYGPGEAQDLEEDYLRTSRRARGVVERVFFG